MEILIVVLIAAVVFALLWYAIGLIPIPAGIAWLRNVLYIVLILAACVFLWDRFVR